MVRLLDEHLISFGQGVRSLPGRPSLSTGYRCALRGVRGVRLETIVCGGRRFTSHEALQRFVAATTAAANERTSHPMSQPLAPAAPATKEADLERELDAKGL